MDQPKSFCRCGHTGDGLFSEHLDTFSAGHGPCLKCDCPRFTWVGWTPAGEVAIAAKQEEKRQKTRRH